MREWTRKHSLGGVRFRSDISDHEAAVLRSMVTSVVGMLDAREQETPQDDLAALTGMQSGSNEAPSDPVLARLLPDFHRPEHDKGADPVEGADLNGALRSLHELDIIAEKRRVAREMLASLPQGGGRVTLTPEQADSWVTALNDVRLALGAALGIDADTPEQLPDDDPRAGELDIYHWATWVQDSLVQVMMQ
ncbi:oxidative stress transcriptional regulator AosR [Tomitella gaofuii]|uniref:oxidative stress transcriptional regulator AosR n=1 Tax=Tomitella gaofuii TaxID=2760083 RepID=UPI0015FB67E8|nr:DUF2017 domain-containing protein [Tomitella gaofuii]